MRTLLLGTLGAVPAEIPERCYDLPTDDHPHKGGFRMELEAAHAACDACKAKLKQQSPDSYCKGVRDACGMWGIIPDGTDPAKIPPKMQDACIAQCKQDVGSAMVRRFCDGSSSSSPADTQPSGDAQGSAAKSKSSALPWVIGGLVLAAAGAGLLFYGRSLRPNPTRRSYYAEGWGSTVGPYETLPEAVSEYERRFRETPEQVVLGSQVGSSVVGDVIWRQGRPGDVYEPNPPSLAPRLAHVPLYVLKGNADFEPFTLRQFSEDNEFIDPHVIAQIGDMQPGQTRQFDLGASGSFGIKRIS